MADALYVPDGPRFVPTDHTTGPWDVRAQHGGAPAALLARAVEAVDAPVAMQVARLTFDLLRPVPLEPLTVSTSVVREGRRVQLVAASLAAGDVEVVRVQALRIRVTPLGPLDTLPPVEDAPPGPGHGSVIDFPAARVGDHGAFHLTGCEIRFVDGGFDRPGPATAWVRLRVPVVAGETPSPLSRLAAAADFGNGLSWVLPAERWTFVNPDLTVHLHRPPVGEWVGLRSTSFVAGHGTGVAESALYDGDGRVGRSVQSLLLDERG